MKNKIDLFEKQLRLLDFYCFNNKNRYLLKKIFTKLNNINIFRNNLLHANWITINKKGKVRIKFFSDLENGRIKFKYKVISVETIYQQIDEIENIIPKIDEYFEDNSR
jgi:hypothetical protein